jgi:DNA-directed RNA polymerase specialized sigma24 family protein
MPTTTETVIVAALRSGNLRRAVELLLDTYQEELFSYCARLVGGEQASAVYQRVLALAMENVSSLQETASVRAWLYRIARAIILQFHRATPRAFPRAMSDDYVPVLGPAAEEEEHPPSPEIYLDPAVLEVLQLVLWHGLLLFEVAQVVDRSENEVRRLASQGLSRLALQGDGSVPPS